MLGRTSIEISHGKIVIIWVIFIKTTVFKQSAVVFQVYYKSPHHPSLYAIKPFLIILKTATWLNSDSSIITKPHVITMRTISLMLSPAYKIPKFVLAVASKLTKLETPNHRMLSLYSIYTSIPILMCVGLIVAQL